MTSPIEARLLDAILALAPQLHIAAHVCFGWQSVDVEPVDHASDDTRPAIGDSVANLMIYPEALVRGYRADLLLFLVMPHRGVPLSTALVVECDGHDWHERTQQQAAYDRARDRDILRGGWATIRFTGSEIHRDANQCANDVLQVIGAIHESRARDIGRHAEAIAQQHIAHAVELLNDERRKKDGG